MRTAAELRSEIESALASRIPGALSPRPLRSPELVSCGVPEVDALLGGGLPLGAVVELSGAPSSGRTTVALSAIAEVTRQGHCCAYVDCCDALDPLSAAALGVELPRLLWVRPREVAGTAPSPQQHLVQRSKAKTDRPARSSQTRPDSMRRLETALRATDLLLNTGGFRVVVLDIADVPPQQALRTPIATWYRFRLQAEKSQMLLLVLTAASEPNTANSGASRPSGVTGSSSGVQSCAAVSLYCNAASPEWRRADSQSPLLLTALGYHFELKRDGSLPAKKPPASTGTAKGGARWQGKTSWTG
jgi:hypothetical protein